MLSEEIEQLERQRNRIILGSGLSFAVWWGLCTVLDAGWVPKNLALRCLQFLGWATWIVYFWRFWRWQQRVHRNPAALAALNDERILRNRMRAAQAAWVTVMVCLVLGRALTTFVPLPATLLLDAMILLAVVISMGGYLWFSRD